MKCVSVASNLCMCTKMHLRSSYSEFVKGHAILLEQWAIKKNKRGMLVVQGNFVIISCTCFAYVNVEILL